MTGAFPDPRCSDLEEIPEDLHTDSFAFFRVELAGEHVSALHGRVDRNAVPGPRRNNGGIGSFQVIGVDKIDERAFIYPFKESPWTGK